MIVRYYTRTNSYLIHPNKNITLLVSVELVKNNII